MKSIRYPKVVGAGRKSIRLRGSRVIFVIAVIVAVLYMGYQGYWAFRFKDLFYAIPSVLYGIGIITGGWLISYALRLLETQLVYLRNLYEDYRVILTPHNVPQNELSKESDTASHKQRVSVNKPHPIEAERLSDQTVHVDSPPKKVRVQPKQVQEASSVTTESRREDASAFYHKTDPALTVTSANIDQMIASIDETITNRAEYSMNESPHDNFVQPDALAHYEDPFIDDFEL